MAYAIAFLQRVGLQTFLDRLAVDFHTGADGIGVLVSAYFYGYVALQIPAGVLVDTFGVRRIVLSSLMISCIGTVVFAIASDLPTAFAGRMIVASGDALIFTAIIKMVAQQFDEKHFGLMAGLSQVSGYLGGMLATTPLAMLVAYVGWRTSFAMLAGILIFNIFACYLVLPYGSNEPSGSASERWAEVQQKVRRSLAKMVSALGTGPAWGCALIFASHFVAVTSLTAAWGVPMLMQAYGLNRTDATKPMFVFMMMNIVGSIAFGYLSDKIRKLPAAMLFSCLIRTALLLMLVPHFGIRFDFAFILVIFGALGLVAGSMVPLILKYLKSVYAAEHVATGVAINSSLAGIIVGFMQLVIGFALEASWTGLIDENGKHYSIDGYNSLMCILIIMSLPGIIGPEMLGRKGFRSE